MVFVQARNFTRTSGRQIDLVVIHDMEAPETTRTAENVANWFAGANAPRASAHWCHDSDSSVRCVADKDVAWHAPGANHNGIGHELAGYARQTRAEWLDPFGLAMLPRVAAQVRVDCANYGIPLRFVGPDGLRRGERGLTIHRYVSEAFHRSTHWDTGYHFPEAYFLELVRSAAGPHVTPNPVPVDDGLLSVGDRGTDVTDWQRILAGAGIIAGAAVDGVFGPKTKAATIIMQTKLGVTADGVVGPDTRRATARLLAWLAAARPAPVVPPFPGTVWRGSTGGAVSVVQARLRDRGWGIVVDGVFGPRTEAFVRAFQADKHLTVDGIVGPQTWATLWAAPIT